MQLSLTHMSRPPLATKAMLIAALPTLRSECAILPPSLLSAARVWNVRTLEGRAGVLREEPYSTAILRRQCIIEWRIRSSKGEGDE